MLPVSIMASLARRARIDARDSELAVYEGQPAIEREAASLSRGLKPYTLTTLRIALHRTPTRLEQMTQNSRGPFFFFCIHVWARAGVDY